MRMPREAFLKLHLLLVSTGGLSSSPHVTSEEKLSSFLYIVGQNMTNRSAQERFQRSGWTINRNFHEVLSSIVACSSLSLVGLVRLDCPEPIRTSSKFFPFFENCIGALDGTHIPVHVPVSQQKPFRNRKGFLSQNVLGVCNFDMQFTFIMAGWEGSASDGAVFQHSLRNGFEIPLGKYYLGDAGYALSPQCLTPYRGVRYHLREWAKGNKRPQNAKELFNIRHAQLRNVIERAFGVLKKRFLVLRTAQEYALETHVKLVHALCRIHNFIRREWGEDLVCQEYDAHVRYSSRQTKRVGHYRESSAYALAKIQRDQIAHAMWSQYVERK
ncbi:hypothetical protein AeNC1_016772 [Aphanomyces euteiches]|nr:hypothetical protein AeNC1_016772 [Aphanomyces euteiches]